jgi:hypothetical protein
VRVVNWSAPEMVDVDNDDVNDAHGMSGKTSVAQTVAVMTVVDAGAVVTGKRVVVVKVKLVVMSVLNSVSTGIVWHCAMVVSSLTVTD